MSISNVGRVFVLVVFVVVVCEKESLENKKLARATKVTKNDILDDTMLQQQQEEANAKCRCSPIVVVVVVVERRSPDKRSVYFCTSESSHERVKIISHKVRVVVWLSLEMRELSLVAALLRTSTSS